MLIAGAGPVGLTMAKELTRYGVRSASSTKRRRAPTSRKPWCCGADRWNCSTMGYVEPFLAAGMTGARRAACPTARTSSREISLRRRRQPLPLCADDPAERHRARAGGAGLEQLGIKVERRVELGAAVAASADGVRHGCARRPARGNRAADWLIGCDGAHSTVRHGAGSRLRRHDADRSDWLLADVTSPDSTPDELRHLLALADGILAFFPIVAGPLSRRRRPRAAERNGHHADPTLAEVQALVDERGAGQRLASRPDLARQLPHQRAQGRRLPPAAASSSPATPPTSTAPPAARA